MRKIFLTSAICLLGATLALQATDAEWVNRTTVNNPQVDATKVQNYGIIYIRPVNSPISFFFDNTRYFYNEPEGAISISGGLKLEYHNSAIEYGKTNSIPMDLYQNEGYIMGGPLSVYANEVIDSGSTDVGGYSGVQINGDNLDLWGARYIAVGGNSMYLDANGNVQGSYSRPPGIYAAGWGIGINDYFETGPVASVYAVGAGTSAQITTPLGSGDMARFGVVDDGAWWNDTNYKVYINETMYEMGSDPKPFYQVVFVPGDTIVYEYEDPTNPVSAIKTCKSYNQFRVNFLGSPYDMPFAPYTSRPDHGARAVHVAHYLYQSEDTQQGLRYPRYEQIHYEDLTGYFYDEIVAGNTYVGDFDGRGYIPNRFRIDRARQEVPYTVFVYAPWRGAEIGELALPPRYAFDPATGDMLLDAETGLPIPTWTQEDAVTGRGPFLPVVGKYCLSGSRLAGTDDNDLIWLRPGNFPYGPDPENGGSDIIASRTYNAYSTTVGVNGFDKVQLVQAGLPLKGDIDSSSYPGHVTINGGTAGTTIDNLVAEAEQAITLNITNLVSANNIVLNANYVNAYFSRVFDAKYPNNKLKISEVMSPQMTRLVGGAAMYSAIYNVELEICKTAFDRNAAPVEPVDPGEGEGEGEGETEPEWEGVDFLYHLVFITDTANFLDQTPTVDNFVVSTKCPSEVTDTISFGEHFTFDTPDLTLEGTFTFPMNVNGEKFLSTINNFTNYAALETQGNNRLSGSSTNTTDAAPAIDLYLGNDREQRYTNLVNYGSMFFNQIWLDADRLQMSDGGSTITLNGTILEGDQVVLQDASARSGGSTEIIANNLTAYTSVLSTGDATYSATTNATLTLRVANDIDDGFNGYATNGVVLPVAPNEWAVSGAFKMANKPATGDLLNTELTIINPRISRNTWAGEDLGDFETAWTNNVALGALILRGTLIGNSALRFDFSGESKDHVNALYVRDLYLGVDTVDESVTISYDNMLNLKNMKLYYVNCYVLKELPAPPGGALDNPEKVWVLVDKYPATNENIIQTQHHPNWTTSVGPMSADMGFTIQVINPVDGVQDAAGELLELSWKTEADATYVVKYAESLDGEWFDLQTVRATENGVITIPLQPNDALRFYRLIKQ